jgi:hypothetical protein
VPLLPPTASDSAEVSCVTTLPSAESATCIRLCVLDAVCTKLSSWLIAELRSEACPAATGSAESDDTRSPDDSSAVNCCSERVELFNEATSPLT